MEIRTTLCEGRARVTVTGELGENELQDLGKALDALMTRGFRRIALDLSGVPFMSASGLARLVDHWGATRFHRGELIITALNSRLAHLFRSMGLEGLLENCRRALEVAEPAAAGGA